MNKFAKIFACSLASFAVLSTFANGADVSTESELRSALSDDGGTHRLACEIENISSPFVVSEGSHVLDLNGFSLVGTADSPAVILVTGGELTITESSSTVGAIKNEGLTAVGTNGGKLTIDDGRFYGKYSGCIAEENSDITINGGQYTGGSFGIKLNGTPTDISISGGNFSAGQSDEGIGLCVYSGENGRYRTINVLADGCTFDDMNFFPAKYLDSVYWCTGANVNVGTSKFKQKMPDDVNSFSDVDDDKWYGANNQKTVATAYSYGIMNGFADGTFRPGENVKISEAVKIASVMHSTYFDNGYSFDNVGENWYDVYVNYATQNGIISGNEFDDYTRPAKRMEIAYIFANSLPGDELTAINNIKNLPDVDSDCVYFSHILALYNAGILSGNDSIGTFTPNAEITRAEISAIISRMICPNKRVGLTFGTNNISEEKEETVEQDISGIDGVRREYEKHMNSLEKTFSFTVDTSLYKDVAENLSEWGKYSVKSGSYTYNSGTEELELTLEYRLSFEVYMLCKNPGLAENASAEARTYFRQIDELTRQIVSADSTEREKLKAIHDYMVSHYSYDLSFGANYEDDESYSFRGLLNNGTGVCQAYAELFQMMSERVGINCEFVIGSANNPGQDYQPHAWNSVVIDGQTLYVDVTYDDPVPDTAEGRDNYFLVTADELKKDHIWEQ